MALNLPLKCWDYRHMPYLFTGCWELNPELHACKATPFPTEPALTGKAWGFFFLTEWDAPWHDRSHRTCPVPGLLTAPDYASRVIPLGLLFFSQASRS